MHNALFKYIPKHIYLHYLALYAWMPIVFTPEMKLNTRLHLNSQWRDVQYQHTKSHDLIFFFFVCFLVAPL